MRVPVTTPEESTFATWRSLVDQLTRWLAPAGSTVTLGVRGAPGGCVLSVTDRGCGISQEDLPKIFERFYRADAARNSETGGYGIGLSMAKAIVEKHKGRIAAASDPEKKLTVSITL